MPQLPRSSADRNLVDSRAPTSSTFERQVSRTVQELAVDAGFEPHGHRLDVIGLCAGCRA